MWLLPGPARGWRRLAHVGAWAVGLYVLAGAVIDQDRVQLSPQGAHAASDATAGHGAQAAVVVRVIDGDTIVVQVAGVAATVRLMGDRHAGDTTPDTAGRVLRAGSGGAHGRRAVRDDGSVDDGPDRGPRGCVWAVVAVRRGWGRRFQRGARTGGVRASGPGLCVCTPGGVHRA